MTDNRTDIQDRLHKVAKKYLIILSVAIAYLVFVLCTGIGIPCLFHEITGLLCVGCGISRMFIALAHLDVAAAFHYNPFVFITGPIIVAYIVCMEIKYVRSGSRKMGKWEVVLWIEIVLAIIYSVLRNIFPI